MTTAPEIRAALRRLQRSDTPRKRKSARLALNRTVRDWLAQTLAEHPALRTDGTAVVPAKRRGSHCPYCRVPLRSTRQLVEYLSLKHGQNYAECPCGWECPSGHWGNGAKHKTRHLAHVGDLTVHFARGVMLATLSNGDGS